MIDHGRDTEQPLALSPRLWHDLPTPGRRLIRAIQPGLTDFSPVRSCVHRKRLPGHPIHAGCPLVAFHSLPCMGACSRCPQSAPSGLHLRLAVWPYAASRHPRTGSAPSLRTSWLLLLPRCSALYRPCPPVRHRLLWPLLTPAPSRQTLPPDALPELR